MLPLLILKERKKELAYNFKKALIAPYLIGKNKKEKKKANVFLFNNGEF